MRKAVLVILTIEAPPSPPRSCKDLVYLSFLLLTFSALSLIEKKRILTTKPFPSCHFNPHFFATSSAAPQKGNGAKRVEKCKAVIFPTTVSSVLLLLFLRPRERVR